jgi:bla regulator protein blaR1
MRKKSTKLTGRNGKISCGFAYDKVNWDKVNYQLSNAVSQVRMDSLQKVYNIALSKYDHIQKELKANNVKGIPDTDITLAEIDQKKREAQKAINNIKAIRNKKIVSL